MDHSEEVDFGLKLWQQQVWLFLENHDLDMDDLDAADVDLNVCVASGDFDSCVRNDLFVHELNLLDGITQTVTQEYQSTGVKKVYFNRYGYSGLLQYVDGYWIYERPPGWLEGEEDVHFIYIDGNWEVYDPPVMPEDMHFLSALVDALLDTGHSALDLVGLIPLAGEIADGINAIWYYAEGDMVNGALSTASMVPVLGYTANAAKWSRNVLKLSDGIFHSSKGLEFSSSRLKHIVPNNSKNFHGVFSEIDDVVGVVDDAYGKYLNNIDVLEDIIQSDGRRRITINMKKDIGVESGKINTGVMLQKIRIILESADSKKIISAFPAQ